MGRAGQARSIRLASAGLWGLPKTSPFTSTTVSQPMTTAPGCWAETAKHLPRASSSTSVPGWGRDGAFVKIADADREIGGV